MILGHMIQGAWIADDGSTYQPVTVYFDLLRLWDSRAVWHKMETDTTALAANILFAKSRKAQVMFTFGEPPDSALAPGYRKVPTIAAWTKFVQQLVAVEGIDVFEGWNEAGFGDLYWDGTPELLVEYQRILYTTVKSQTKKLVLSPSFTEPNLPRGRDFIQRFVAAGGLQWCDAVAWHGYAAHPDDLRSDHAALVSLVGTKLPIWNTEYMIGPPTSVEQRIQFIIDSMAVQKSLNVKCAVWNPEIPGCEDYTDSTMQLVHNQQLSSPNLFHRFIAFVKRLFGG